MQVSTFMVTLLLMGLHVDVVPPAIQLFDRFGDTCCDDEKARLDNFALALANQPGALGYIVFYGGRRQNYPYCWSARQRLQRRGEAQARAARIKPYLVYNRGIDSARVFVIDGGYRESWTAELWIVPLGASPPIPSPTVQPREIRFRRGRIKPHDYDCEV